MTPTLRGESGNPGYYELFYGEVDDVIAAGQYLADLPYVDAEKVFVAGHSTGGTLTILAAMMPSPFIAAAAIGGAADPRIWMGNAPFNQADPREFQLRTPMEFPESLSCPLYLIVGRNDPTILSGADQFVRAATGKGKVCHLSLVEGNHFSSLKPGIEESIRIFDIIVLREGFN